MDKKSLLEELRALTPSFKPVVEKEDEELDLNDVSLKDAIEDEDKYLEDEQDSYEKQELEDEEEDEHEEGDEEGEDLDGDGEADDVHALFKLKDAFDSSDDEMKHALVMFARIILDTNTDMETLQKFVDDVDLEDSEENTEDSEDEEDMDLEDMEEYGDEEDSEEDDSEEDEEDEEEEFKKESSDEDDEFDEFKGNLYESLSDVEMFDSDRETYFTNESLIADEYDMMDMLD